MFRKSTIAKWSKIFLLAGAPLLADPCCPDECQEEHHCPWCHVCPHRTGFEDEEVDAWEDDAMWPTKHEDSLMDELRR